MANAPLVQDSVDRSVSLALGAISTLRSADRPLLLRTIADALDARREAIIECCAAETALTPSELAPEFSRMTGTLRMFAQTISDSAWMRPWIDEPLGETSKAVGPNHDVRRMLVPLDGVVAVFGASNFPFAYGVCGGDTASALAAGCPVVVKEHPAHPRTGRLIAEVVRQAAAKAGFGEHVLGYVEHEDGGDLSIPRALITHPGVAAVGFTGSVEGGNALLDTLHEHARWVTLYAEMGSANPVLILPRALERRADEIAHEIAASILSRHGQQCTCPGLILVDESDAAGRFVRTLAELLDAGPSRKMLSPGVAKRYVERCGQLEAFPGVKRVTSRLASAENADLTNPMLFDGALDLARVSESEDDHLLLDEVFGPAAVVVRSRDPLGSLDWCEPSLVTSVYADAEDAMEGDSLAMRLAQRCGRVVFNGVPTGVRVCTAMMHAGPFPSTNRPEATAVGPEAIARWCRPVCWQNWPQELLPPALRSR